ncbi:MAG: hypothetical protein ACKOQ6_02565 [Bacteroidota bacterium]
MKNVWNIISSQVAGQAGPVGLVVAEQVGLAVAEPVEPVRQGYWTYQAAPAQQPRDFFRWLSEKPVAGFGSYEMIDGDDTSILDISNKENIKPETGSQAAIEHPEGKDLIEKFIRSEPRIVPQPKAQFFNPSVQAKRSVEEHEDLVSETLARIYAEQGNLLKARNAYERLRLLHPEKNAYFATLVLKMDNQLNSTTSEDL